MANRQRLKAGPDQKAGGQVWWVEEVNILRPISSASAVAAGGFPWTGRGLAISAGPVSQAGLQQVLNSFWRIRTGLRSMPQCRIFALGETMRSKLLVDCDRHHRKRAAASSCWCHGGGSLKHPALVPELREINGHYANHPRQPRVS